MYDLQLLPFHLFALERFLLLMIHETKQLTFNITHTPVHMKTPYVLIYQTSSNLYLNPDYTNSLKKHSFSNAEQEKT